MDRPTAPALRPALVALALCALALPAGRCLAQGFDETASRSDHEARMARMRLESEERIAQGRVEKRVWGPGIDVGVTYPSAGSGWSGEPGFSFGLGGRGTLGRLEVSAFRWTRQVRGTQLDRLDATLFLGWRLPIVPDPYRYGGLNTRGLWVKLGGELGVDQQDAMTASGYPGKIGFADLGVAGGVGLTLPLGSVYLTADATAHYAHKVGGTAYQEVLGLNPVRSMPFFTFGVMLGYAGSRPM
jgi:hypothetical protein